MARPPNALLLFLVALAPLAAWAADPAAVITEIHPGRGEIMVKVGDGVSIPSTR